MLYKKQKALLIISVVLFLNHENIFADFSFSWSGMTIGGGISFQYDDTIQADVAMNFLSFSFEYTVDSYSYSSLGFGIEISPLKMIGTYSRYIEMNLLNASFYLGLFYDDYSTIGSRLGLFASLNYLTVGNFAEDNWKSDEKVVPDDGDANWYTFSTGLRFLLLFNYPETTYFRFTVIDVEIGYRINSNRNGFYCTISSDPIVIIMTPVISLFEILSILSR
jgi:hypothetical protein